MIRSATPLANGKRIFVLSDSEPLARTVEFCLCQQFRIGKLILPATPVLARHARAVKTDLMIVALASSLSEPVIVLSQALVVNRVGRVPLLIISDRSFTADHRLQIYHLNFPFVVERLQSQVSQILRMPLIFAAKGERQWKRSWQCP